jgi:hypothetical protein
MLGKRVVSKQWIVGIKDIAQILAGDFNKIM